MGLDFDAVVNLVEDNPVEVKKVAMPVVTGKRRPASFYSDSTTRVFQGYVVEGPVPKLIHDLQVGRHQVSHVAELRPSEGGFSLHTIFALAKQDPRLRISFTGDLEKTEDGYAGWVTAHGLEVESFAYWEFVFD